MSLIFQSGACSHQGLVRPNNEDAYVAGPRTLAVADGVGGHAAGEIASAEVISCIAQLGEPAMSAELTAGLRAAIGDGDARLRALLERDTLLEGMATTLTVVALAQDDVYCVASIGDSRAYLFRDGALAQLTRDDSYVQQLLDEGAITHDVARTHPQRSLVMQAVDGRGKAELSVAQHVAQPGDRLLLCSDGLSDLVATDAIAGALLADDPQPCAERLLALALAAGGPDNVTAIVADVRDDHIELVVT